MSEIASNPIEREAARVLLVDAAGRVLLFEGRDPVYDHRGRWWFTPGGGLDAGESPRDGAARELFEETGLSVSPEALGEPVHSREATFPWGDDVYRQTESYYRLDVPAHVVDTSGFDEVERQAVTGHRWWSREELAATAEVFYPRELLDLLP